MLAGPIELHFQSGVISFSALASDAKPLHEIHNVRLTYHREYN
jgi:hypothetical protein